MTIDELIQKKESETAEFKENFGNDTIETAVAFANTKGGIILLGVSDDGDVRGTHIGKESLADWANRISQSTEPSIIPELEVVEDRNVVIIKISEFPIKPVATRGRCYRRVGNSNRVMTPQEVAQMHLQSVGGSWDLYPATDTAIEELNLEAVNQYIKTANSTGRRKIGDEEPLQVLEKLELIKDGQPTWAASLLFGINPQRHLSQAKTHCGRFKSETVVVDERMIEGTIIEQVEEAMDFIRKNINVGLVMTGKPARDEVWDYPLEALREAVTNALCHRDYTIPSYSEIKIYDDKLVIWSPGGLPLGVTIEDLYNPHSSAIRNKGIATVFYDLGLIEQWGSGIDKMLQSCAIAGNPKPEFEENRGVSVTLRKDIYTEDYLKGMGLNDRQIFAILHINKIGSINLSSFKELIPDTGEKTLYRDLQDLVDREVIVPVGEKKGRIYKLK